MAIWLRHTDSATGTAPILAPDPLLTAHQRNGTWSNTTISEAVDALVRIGVIARVQPMAFPGDLTGRIRINHDALREIGIWARSPLGGHGDAPAVIPDVGQARKLVLVSFFDGMGTARLAMGDTMCGLNDMTAFYRSVFVELDRDMAHRVERFWAASGGRALDGGPEHQLLCHDVWDLFLRRHDGLSYWDRFLDTLDPGTLVLLVGGSPCNSLSRAGTYGGYDGLAGRTSWHFFASSLAVALAATRRPDVFFHPLCENVHPMQDLHRQGIRDALGGIPAANAVIMNTTDHAPAPRQRTWFATFPGPDPADLPVEPRIPPPWERGWAFRHDGVIPTWTRSRGDPDEILPSMYQTGMKHLLYDLEHANRWFLGSLDTVKTRILAILDRYDSEWRGLRTGFLLVSAGKERDSHANEQLVAVWGRWLMRHGRDHGIRVPSAEERARAVGMAGYLTALGLQDRPLYDAVGMHFDPRCMRRRITTFLRSWRDTGAVTQPQFPQPRGIVDIFVRLHAGARRHRPFATLVHSPFRADVEQQLIQDGLLDGPTRNLLARP